MRAVSLQVQDSAGVVALLKPGHRVDVQVVSNLSSPQGTEPYLRTVLENMTVLTVPRDPASSRGPHVVTVIATPKEAAALGLADSSAKVRFALRNPLDPKKDNLNALALSSLFRQSSPLPTENTRAVPGSTPVPGQKPVQLTVRVIGAQAGVWQQFAPHLLGFSTNSAVPQVSALRLGAAFEETVSRLAGSHDLEVGTTSKLVAYGRRELSLRTAADGSHLRVQFQPFVLGDNSLRLRLNPELTSGATTRRVDTEIELVNGQSFLIRGLTGPDDAGSVWNSLFPNRKAGSPWKDLILLVEARLI